MIAHVNIIKGFKLWQDNPVSKTPDTCERQQSDCQSKFD